MKIARVPIAESISNTNDILIWNKKNKLKKRYSYRIFFPMPSNSSFISSKTGITKGLSMAHKIDLQKPHVYKERLQFFKVIPQV